VFAHIPIFLAYDFQVTADGITKSLVERAGGEYKVYDAQASPEAQVSILEDLATVTKPDAVLIEPAEESAVVSPCQKVLDAGIPIFNWDHSIPNENITSTIYHDNAEMGELIGGWFVEKAEETGRQLNIFEKWGVRAMDGCQARHSGFMKIVSDHPLITVTESADCNWSDETSMNLIVDAFTAHPELNAIYSQGTGEVGMGEALDMVGRLLPHDDPDHVLLTTIVVVEDTLTAMNRGALDAAATHNSWDLMDVTVKQAFSYVVLGQPVPKSVCIPMVVATPENINTLRLYGAVTINPLMPDNFDLWPVLDTSEIGIYAPTKEMRMEQKGY